MAQRVQVSDLRATPTITPAVKPVDTYYRPVANTVAKPEGPGEFEQLLNAFTESAAPALNQAIDKQFKFQTEEEQKQGAAARLKNQKSFKDAVNSGLIPEGASPWFVKGYMQQEGRIDGIEYDAALRTAWSNDPVKDSNNPADLTKFMGEFRAKWMESRTEIAKNLDYMDGLSSHISQAENNLGAQHIAHRQQEISAKVRDNTFREITALAKNFQLAGQNEGDPTVIAANKESYGALISGRVNSLVANGLPGREVNAIMTEALAIQALEAKDPTIMDIADHIVTRDGAKLSGTAQFRDKKLQVENHLRSQDREDTRWSWAQEDRPHAIRTKEWAEETWDHERQERARRQTALDKKERADELQSDLYVGLLANKPIDPARVEALAKLDPNAAAQYQHFKKFLRDSSNEIVVDKKAVAGLLMQIARDPNAVSPAVIFGGVAAEKWDLPQATHAYSMWKEALSTEPAFQDPVIRGMMQKLEGAIIKDPSGLYGGGQLDALAGTMEFRAFVKEVNADTSIPQSEKYARLRKKVFEIAKEYNTTGTELSQAAQAEGVVPKVSTKTPKPAAAPQESAVSRVASGGAVGGVGAGARAAEKATTFPTPSAKSIEILKKDPNQRALFDQTYGPGAADKVLGAK